MRQKSRILRIFTRSLLFATTAAFLSMLQAHAAPKLAAPSVPGTISLSSTLKPDYPFREGYPFRGGKPAHATLSVANNTRIRQGATPDRHDSFDVNICLYNDGGFDFFYNVFWDPFIAAPGRLALYDAQKHYVCDLLEGIGGSAMWPTAKDWAAIRAPGYIGMIRSLSLPYPSYRRIPPGTYTLQVIYLARLVKPPTDTHAFDPADLQELFRSNTVKITVIDPAAPKPAPSVETP